MKLRFHVLLQFLGVVILSGVFITWIVTGQQSTILAGAGLMLILVGAVESVEFAEREDQ